MKTVHRQSVKVGQHFHLPIGATPTLLGLDAAGDLCVWYEVKEKDINTLGSSVYEIFGTGWRVPKDSVHVKSCIVDGYVWHLYRSAA